MSHPQDERNASIETMFRQGLTYQVIGEQFGLTRERVRQILAKRGVSASEGGVAFRCSVKSERARLKREAYYAAKYGLSFDDVKKYRVSGLTRAFGRQKESAAQRGIAFNLTFAQWLSVWQASGKLEQRGRGKRAYCMSRISDKGGYEVGNVHIQTNEQNGREAVKHWVGKVKDSRGVFRLYPGTARPFVVRVGKLQVGRYETEKEAAQARAEYLMTCPWHPEAKRAQKAA